MLKFKLDVCIFCLFFSGVGVGVEILPLSLRHGVKGLQLRVRTHQETPRMCQEHAVRVPVSNK